METPVSQSEQGPLLQQKQTTPTGAAQMEKQVPYVTSTITTTTAPPETVSPAVAEGDAKIEKVASMPVIPRSGSASNIASATANTNLIKEQPIVREVTEKPVLAEVVHRPSVEVHHRQVITEVHEKPQVEFREVPMVVTTRDQPLYRQFAEKMRVEDFTSRELIQNPYVNVTPKVLQEAPITREVQESAIIREIHEQPIIEIHHQPVIREIREKPVIEIHEQEIIRKYTDTPIVRVTRAAEQTIQQNAAQASSVTTTAVPLAAKELTPKMGGSGVMQQTVLSTQPIGQQIISQPIHGDFSQSGQTVTSSVGSSVLAKQPVLIQEPISTPGSFGVVTTTPVSQHIPQATMTTTASPVSMGSPILSSAPVTTTQPGGVTTSQSVVSASSTSLQASVNQALAEAPPVYVERRPSFADKFKRAIGI